LWYSKAMAEGNKKSIPIKSDQKPQHDRKHAPSRADHLRTLEQEAVEGIGAFVEEAKHKKDVTEEVPAAASVPDTEPRVVSDVPVIIEQLPQGSTRVPTAPPSPEGPPSEQPPTPAGEPGVPVVTGVSSPRTVDTGSSIEHLTHDIDQIIQKSAKEGGEDSPGGVAPAYDEVTTTVQRAAGFGEEGS
jgi:hypothetical protein